MGWRYFPIVGGNRRLTLKMIQPCVVKGVSDVPWLRQAEPEEDGVPEKKGLPTKVS
jgi:hypothetical protein